MQGDFERLKAAGASRHRALHDGEAPGAWIATLADPDDNYFQLVSPMEMPG